MTEEERGHRLYTETEPFEQHFTPKDNGGNAPNRWMQLRAYEVTEYADLWVYRYKLGQVPAWWGGYIHWFGVDLSDVEGDRDDDPPGPYAFGERQHKHGNEEQKPEPLQERTDLKLFVLCGVIHASALAFSLSGCLSPHCRKATKSAPAIAPKNR